MVGLKPIIVVLVGSLILIAGLVWLLEARDTGNNDLSLNNQDNEEFAGPYTEEEQNLNNKSMTETENKVALIKTNFGTITIELYTGLMPITTENFISLANEGFYDETKFHRVIPGFMIQAGDPNTKTDNEASYGQGGPEQNIQDEFVDDEKLTNQRGTIAMANTGQPNSGGSQFFINLGDNSGLDYDKEPLSSKHPVFGKVVDGMDIVDKIAGVETKERDIPVEPVIVESIEITNGSN